MTMGQRETEDESTVSDSTKGKANGSEQKREDTRGGENMALDVTNPNVEESCAATATTSQTTKLASCSLVGGAGDLQDSVIQNALSIKCEGNALFKDRKYKEASEKYTAAIALLEDKGLDPLTCELHIYLCNRAFCHLLVENYGLALIDAGRAIDIKPNYTKAYYRRGIARFCLRNIKGAAVDFERVCTLTRRRDPDAVYHLNECKKLLRAEAFKAAIATDRSIPVSEQVLAAGLDKLFPVSEDYSGPVYKSNEVDPSFLIELREFLKTPGNKLHQRYAFQMALDLIEVLKKSSSLVRIQVPEDEVITVCGDVHGQYYDLVNIFDINGMPSENNMYLFNGDIVDRGSFSVEVVLLLTACKLAYPNHFHINRGNHETLEVNALYGFKGEMCNKYNEKLYAIFNEAFCLLPLAFVINSSIFVVHGGLSRSESTTLSDIEKIDRKKEPGDDTLMTDLLWSDPCDLPGVFPSKRGVAFQFGPDITEAFLKRNNLSLVIRSHEMKHEGYEVTHNGKLITVFSAPNYCDEMNNKGAFIRVNGRSLEKEFKTFSAVPHPEGRAMQYANPLLSLV